MPDAFVNARYHDETFDMECTITEIEEDDDGRVWVHLEYESGAEPTVRLEMFKNADSFETLEVPDDVGRSE